MTRQTMYLRMITASLARRRSRMLVALLAIVVGATVLCGLVTIYYDMPRQMGMQFRGYGANLILVPDADAEGISVEQTEAAVGVIPQTQLVGVAPYHYESMTVNAMPVVVAATDLAAVRATSPYWYVSGEWPDAPGEVLVGKEEAATYDLAVGDTVTLAYVPAAYADAVAAREAVGTDAEDEDEATTDEDATATAADATTETDAASATAANDDATSSASGDAASDALASPEVTREFTVVGTLDTGGSEEERFFISTDDMAEMIGEDDTGYDVVELSLQATSDELSRYADEIAASVPGVTPQLVKRVAASEATVLTKLQALVLIVTVIVLALTMICVATTMTAVVTERRREIGLRKALGASDRSITLEFMGEGLLLGAVGGLAGAGLGFAFAQAVSTSVFNSSITFRPLLVPVSVLAALVVTAAASALPVRNATKVDPALVLKGE